MEFLVFRRADSALVVVPAMFEPPLASRRDGLAFTAVCDIDLDAFTPDVIEALERDGFACIRGPDWQALAAAGDFAMEDGDG